MSDSSTLVVHHLERSRSHRVIWMLEELGLPYRVEHYQRDPDTMLAPASLREVHPLGKAPILTDGDTVVAESGAILDYLAERGGERRLKPSSGSEAALQYRYWLHFAEGSAMSYLLMKLVFDQVESRSPWLVKPIAGGIAGKVKQSFIRPNIERQMRFIDDELASRGKDGHFAGKDFTAADIQMSYPIEAMASRGGLDERYPAAQDWLARMRERPAHQKAIEVGGPVILS